MSSDMQDAFLCFLREGSLAGVRVGSSESEVLAAFGDPEDCDHLPDMKLRLLFYSSCNLQVSFYGDDCDEAVVYIALYTRYAGLREFHLNGIHSPISLPEPPITNAVLEYLDSAGIGVKACGPELEGQESVMTDGGVVLTFNKGLLETLIVSAIQG